MTLLPTANKTKLVKFLRARGYKLPSVRQTRFSRQGRGENRIFVLDWFDNERRSMVACYSSFDGRPHLSVSCLGQLKELTWLTMAEVIQFGLVEEK